MTIVGTSHFVSVKKAVQYYRQQGLFHRDVHRKMSDGEIHIGPPEIKPGETLLVVDNGTRYAIES